jgi:predicted DNA-binding transcriptional regulator AlpA
VVTGILSPADVAELAGVKVQTIHNHSHRHTMPDPDGYLGRTPWWHRATIEAWVAVRPRRGRPLDSK